MGIFSRIRSAGQTADHGNNPADTSEQDATRLIEEGHALEAAGRLDEAMRCYMDAIRLAPNPARGHLNRGNILQMQGDLQGALDAFRTAIKHRPDYAGAYYNIGNALLGNGQYDDAAANYRRALEIQPDYAEVHCSMGVALKELGQLDGAIASFQHALKINPGLVEAHANLGNVLQDLYNRGNALASKGQLESAVETYRKLLGIKPDFAEAWCNLGLALQELGQLDDAVAGFRKAIQFKPDLFEAHFNLGIALQKLRRSEDAVSSYHRALAIKPGFAEAHNNLGSALKDLGQLEAAAAGYRRALEINPDFAEAQNNLGLALQYLGQFEDAMASYRRTLEINPEFAEAHFNLSLLLLSLGRYAEAWPKYEARYHPGFKERIIILPDVPYPRWQGESLYGKSLAVWPEQGFGDEIQFARYVPLLKNRGASRVTLVCKSPLKALLETIDGVDEVVSQTEASSLPIHDYWTFPMSLPLHFSTTVDTIPAKLPYLSVPAKRLDQWRGRLPAGGLKVALVWKGNAAPNAHRSLPSLSTLAPLWSVPGVCFVSLQKGPGEDEGAMPPEDQPMLHLGSDIADFADTAAIIDQLDLVICIDTAIAHLAGAMGKPCWVLLPVIGIDWRWLQVRAGSPCWYPEVMRLFRQTKIGDWTAAINMVAQALDAWVSRHGGVIQAQ